MKKLLSILSITIPLSIASMDPNEPVDPRKKLEFIHEYPGKQTVRGIITCISSAVGYYGYTWGIKKQKQLDDHIIDLKYRSPKETVEPSPLKKIVRKTGHATYFTFLKLVPGFVVLPTALVTILGLEHMRNDYITYNHYCAPEKPRSIDNS